MDKPALLVIGNILDKTESQNGVPPMPHPDNPARQMALISMAFNLGGPRLASFRRMRAAIHDDNWMQAAGEARHSCWAKQVGRRSTEIAGILASGVTPDA